MGNACGGGSGNRRKTRSTEEGVDDLKCKACVNPVFDGLGIPMDRTCAFDALLKRMDRVSPKHLTSVNILSGLQRHRTWDLHLFFSDWPAPVTLECVTNLLNAFEAAANDWLANDSALFGSVKVRVFGFVFCAGVTTDASFDKSKYVTKGYPIVRDWTDASEASPWVTTSTSGVSTRNMYDPKLDLHTVKVIGNRTGTGATFHPPTWDAASYKHPEGCAGSQTRFWHGHGKWQAFAQRHYVRVSGVLEDPTRGTFGNNTKVLKHEIGHCFFLDDLYDASKYPTPFPNTVCPCHPRGHCLIHESESIMHKRSDKITPLDRAQLRHVWNACRARAVAATSASAPTP